MLVLAGAGLLVRTLGNLKAENTGFDPHNVLLFSLNTTYSNRTGSNRQLLYHELQQQLTGLPGVNFASYSSSPLLSGMGGTMRIFAADRLSTPIDATSVSVGPDFFQTMRIPLLAGRTLNAQDIQRIQSSKTDSIQPVVIDENLAHVLFGNQPALGRFFFMAGPTGPSSDRREVVGVVGNAKSTNLRDAFAPTMYVPVGNLVLAFEVRTALDPKAMMPEIRTAITRFDPNLLISDMKTQEEQIDQNIYQERLIANLSSLFALLALIVACIGIYGLLSYQVTRRTQEIGIRLALGAQRGDVLRLIIRQGALLAVLGALIGIAAALAVTRYLQSFLFGVKPYDPLTIATVALGLIAVALMASYVPARRAMKTDPMVALRYE
jgi:predicted permease